jgi:hypothetical protein
MVKRWLLLIVIFLSLGAGLYYGSYWVNTQPIQILNASAGGDSQNIPERNKQIIEFVEANGEVLAPDYKQVVCTEFVIRVIEKFRSLTTSEKNKIRIITDEDIPALVMNESPIIKGVHTSLIEAGKGIEVIQPEDVKPGDFVQFWNSYLGIQYGHCGVVFSVEPYKRIAIYSSHPATGGYGKQKFLWPDHIFFVRLR